jgi:hypothetical protein
MGRQSSEVRSSEVQTGQVHRRPEREGPIQMGAVKKLPVLSASAEKSRL